MRSKLKWSNEVIAVIVGGVVLQVFQHFIGWTMLASFGVALGATIVTVCFLVWYRKPPITIGGHTNRQHPRTLPSTLQENDFVHIPDRPELKSLGEIFIRRAKRQAASDEIIEWAGQTLGKGLDSPTLRILAGLPKTSLTVEIETKLKEALNELNVPYVTERQWLIDCVRQVAEDTSNHHISARVGADKIYNLSKVLQYPAELARWSCLQGGDESCVAQGATLERISLEEAILQESRRFLEMVKDHEQQDCVRKNHIDHLLAQLKVRLDENRFRIYQPTAKPVFLVINSVGKPGARISVSADGKPDAPYSVQVNIPDETVTLVGETIPFIGQDLSLSKALDILEEYL